MKYETKISGEIKTGDLIIVQNYFLEVGIFIDEIPGSFRYYNFWQLISWLDEPQRRRTKKGLPYTSFIRSSAYYKIAKFHPDCLSDKNRKDYEIALSALKQLKIIE